MEATLVAGYSHSSHSPDRTSYVKDHFPDPLIIVPFLLLLMAIISIRGAIDLQPPKSSSLSKQPKVSPRVHKLFVYKHIFLYGNFTWVYLLWFCTALTTLKRMQYHSIDDSSVAVTVDVRHMLDIHTFIPNKRDPTTSCRINYLPLKSSAIILYYQ